MAARSEGQPKVSSNLAQFIRKSIVFVDKYSLAKTLSYGCGVEVFSVRKPHGFEFIELEGAWAQPPKGRGSVEAPRPAALEIPSGTGWPEEAQMQDFQPRCAESTKESWQFQKASELPRALQRSPSPEPATKMTPFPGPAADHKENDSGVLEGLMNEKNRISNEMCDLMDFLDTDPDASAKKRIELEISSISGAKQPVQHRPQHPGAAASSWALSPGADLCRQAAGMEGAIYEDPDLRYWSKKDFPWTENVKRAMKQYTGL